MVRNTYIYPPEPTHADRRRHHRVHGAATCRSSTRSRSRGYHMQEAGANQALELAFTLADGKEYVKTALAKGLDVDEFAGRLSFFWAIGMNFYLEIAKMRAARLLWCRIMKEFDAEEPEEPDAAHALPDLGLEPDRAGPVQQRRAHHDRGDGRGVRRHAEPAHQRASTRRSRCRPSSARASRATRSSSSRKRRTSRNVIDPWAGSYMMEKLTQDMADAAWAIIEEVEAHGRHDARRCDSGWAKLKIEASAAEKQARIDSGQDVIVGVNKYQLDERRRDRHPATSTTTRCATARSRGCKAIARAARRGRGAGRARRADRAAPRAARATCST